MNENTHEYDVFYKPDAPRSDWECFKWAFVEPSLLREYSDTLSKKQIFLQLLRIYVKFIIPLFIGLLLAFAFLSAFYNLPTLFPIIYKEKFLILWMQKINFQERFIFCFCFLYDNLNYVLLGILFAPLLLGLFWDNLLDTSLSIIIVINFFISEFFSDLIFHFIFGLVLTLCPMIANTSKSKSILILILRIVLIMGLSSGLINGFNFGFQEGLYASLYFYLGSIFGFFIGCCRILFYPKSLIKAAFSDISLTNNPYIYDETIRFSILDLDEKLLKEAKKNPRIGEQFAYFLFRYRQLQRRLALKLEHIIDTSIWMQSAELTYMLINSRFSRDEEMEALDVSKIYQDLVPSLIWHNNLFKIKNYLKDAELQSNIGVKLEYYKKCRIEIDKWEKVNLKEEFKGKEHYYEVISHWQRLIREQIQSVEEQLINIEPISQNPFSKGTALSPDRENKNLFLERTDLKDEISLKILTSESMPMFLIQGQRRVGKTTLLKFLPDLLDSARFRVVYQDLQGFGTSRTITEWLSDIWYRIDAELKLKSEIPIFQKDDNPLDVWEQFKVFLAGLTPKTGFKVILAFDEYDAALPKIFQRDIEQSSDLLGRMRSFSQHQNDVIFMFIGSAFFSELKNPSWGNYFVHVSNFRVDYLSRNASLQLITKPTEAFNLKYKEGVPERIYDLAVGHPHLLQFICSELVDYANAKYRNPVGHTDLDYVLKEKLLQRAEQPFSIFWEEFCENNETKKVVKAIVDKTTYQENSHFRRLKEHGYIIETEDKSYKMRVPLFEEWIKLYGDWDD